MKSRTETAQSSLKELMYIGLASFIAACFWFTPIWVYLKGDATNPFSSAYEVFFHSSNPEPMFGRGVDQLGSFWMVHEVGEMLSGEQGSILSDVYHPFGFDLGMHTGFAWVDALMAVPLAWLIGQPGFYNLHIFITVMLSFGAMVLLMRRIGLSLWISIGMAHLGFFHPYVVGELVNGRPTQVHWLFPCLFLVSIIEMQKNRWHWAWSTVAGISLALSCLVYWFGGAGLGFCAIPVCLWLYIQKRDWLGGLKAACILSVLSLGICLAVTYRTAIPLIEGRDRSAYGRMDRPPQETLDLLLLEVPVREIIDVSSWNAVVGVYESTKMPLLLLGLVLIASMVPYGRKEKRPWILGWILGVGFPVGAAVSVSKEIWFPTGFAFFNTVFPPLIRCQYIDRLVMVPILIGLICVGWTLNGIIQKYTRLQDSRASFLIGLCLVLLNIHNMPSHDTLRTSNFKRYPKLYEAVQRKPGAILSLPFERSNNFYVHQIWHEQPIAG
ncbi:MAG: hypothetical protein VX278_17225, partial [Myxococcota bacterium]|nr:hypothetical protein [Myxococcota bacterium]